jgi:uncharacterized protein (DUF2336 family)
MEVAGPILEFSPVLSDEDLLEIISTGPPSGRLGAIARRADVSISVSDAVAATDDIGAIADLLSNSSAQIRETTLDNLIERADSIPLWHAPLVARPQLSAKSAQRLAHVVADNLLGMLRERSDLDSDTLDAVKTIVQQRVSKNGGGNCKGENTSAPALSEGVESTPGDPPVKIAERMHQSGKLGEKVLGHALKSNDISFVLAGLMVRSGLEKKMIDEIISSQSAKGITSMVWKAGLSMEFAVKIQAKMGRISPSKTVKSGPKSEFPLSENEMEWQLEFFKANL